MLDKAEEFMDNVTNLTEKTSSFITNPASFAMNFGSSMFKGKVAEMKSKLVDKEMYMYLVDEFTNEPVFDPTGLYPKVIETKSDLVDQHMPMMRVGLQAMAVMNGAAGLASCFCPGVPNRLVPKGLMEKATKFVDGLDKESNVADYDVLQGEVERQGDGSSGAKRGGELREYEKFLMEHDPKGAFANMMRICNKDTGKAIWVTKESVKKIEGKAGGEAGGRSSVDSAEIKRLEEENAKLFKEEVERQLEIKKLEEKNMELMEKLREMHLSSGESSASSAGEKNLSSAAKLRQTVSAERDTEAGLARDDGLIRKMEKMEEMQRQLREEMQRQDEKIGNVDEKIGNVDEKIGKVDEKIGKGLAKVDEKIGKVDDKMDEVVGAVKNAKLNKKGMFF
jgi:hypothetical protein